MIAVIDYGVGNLFSLTASLKYLDIDTVVTSRREDIEAADRIILPGVGAFADARRKLDDTGLVETIRSQTAAGKPLLGICLGMQLLFDRSLEYGEHEGLGLIPGEVAPIADDLHRGLKVPHIGWNSLRIKEDPLWKYIDDGEYVYYVHSYYARRCAESTIGTSEYDITITGAVRRGSVCGTQFHPEKSGRTGLNILRAFNEL
ncbi:MAG: imidazole glycerol phosphate synthase subunit HisH [Anaerovoracaceae bacterium]|jgi:glutamine amidotransferase